MEHLASDEPIIAASAYKHGVGDDDIRRTYRKPMRAREKFFR